MKFHGGLSPRAQGHTQADGEAPGRHDELGDVGTKAGGDDLEGVPSRRQGEGPGDQLSGDAEQSALQKNLSLQRAGLHNEIGGAAKRSKARPP